MNKYYKRLDIIRRSSLLYSCQQGEETDVYQVFIDGSSGTTGLRIYERISQRKDLRLLQLPESMRKDPSARRDAINQSDIVFLCLPDDAARESAAMCENPDTVIIDTSTAHRVSDDWTYGFPELHGYRERITGSKRIANPGCHASGFIALVAPLVEKGILNPDARLSCTSLTGYSGGGKKMITAYEDPENADILQAPRLYGLTQNHKHLAEMVKVCGLVAAPHFCPVVSSYYAGMEVAVPVFREDLSAGLQELKQVYSSYYSNGLVHYAEDPDEEGFLSAAAFAGRDDMQISIQGCEDRILLVSRFDNLGKGASGAAIQNMNLVLGLEETTGLIVEVES